MTPPCDAANGSPAPSSAPSQGFDLLSNPFAVLGATPRTPQHELAAETGRADPAVSAALRAVSVPRSRLAAEVGFLPGAAAAAADVLAALRRGGRPDLAALPPAARANVLAHLCAAGLATGDDQEALAALQPAPADPALQAAVTSDREAAGVPPLQPAALAVDQAALMEQHAAALARSCMSGPDPAARLAALVRGAAAGPPAALLRRAAAAWARQSAGRLADLEEQAAGAGEAALGQLDAPSMARLCDAVRAWAALSLPQRLADARAGLDHAPALRVLRGWRATASRLSGDGRPDLALPLLQAAADAFADLPGEAVQLRGDVRACAGMLEERTLDGQLAPLRAEAARHAADPGPLAAALAQQPFGPGAMGAAAGLWAAFDTACAACVTSEAPWTILRSLAGGIGGGHKMAGAGTALALHRGLVTRAEAAGFTGLAARLRAEGRGLERAAAIWTYLELKDRPKSPWGSPFRRRQVLAAARRALPLVDDPAERSVLQAEERKLVRAARSGWAGMAVIAAIAAAVAGVTVLDNAYTRDAPYRHAPPQTIASAPSAPPAGPWPDWRDTPAPVPVPSMPVVPVMPAAPSAADLGPPKDPVPLSVPSSAKPGSTAPVIPTTERPPRPGTSMRSLFELRWCLFNEVRFEAAFDMPAIPPNSRIWALRRRWDASCNSYDARRGDLRMVTAEVARDRDRLKAEGRAMVSGGPR